MRRQQQQQQRRRRRRRPRCGGPKGCDTFVAYPPTTADGCAIFGKNSDRPTGERQPLRRYPAERGRAPGATVRCTYATIPQVAETHAVLLSQPSWMWGCEHGANEHGVVIGNEAVWTRVPDDDDDDDDGPSPRLLGMDLVRLGLERGATSREALEVVTRLLETHGQGGSCSEDGDPSFTYHNSFLIADVDEAYVLETAGRHWVAERVTTGGRNISNGLTIRTHFDSASDGVREYAKERGWWDGTEPFDFAAIFSEGGAADLEDDDDDDDEGCGRRARGRSMLNEFSNTHKFGRDDMMSILRDHEGGICMHGGAFETTASMVSELFKDKRSNRHWTTGPNPCKSTFCLQAI